MANLNQNQSMIGNLVVQMNQNIKELEMQYREEEDELCFPRDSMRVWPIQRYQEVLPKVKDIGIPVQEAHEICQ